MEKIEWTEELSVGNAEIDDDHRMLFDLLDRLHGDMRTGLINQETASIVDALRHYAETHFSREEAFMRGIGYPHYAAHKAEHERFVSELCALQSRIARGAQTPKLDIDRLLTDWLRQHVMVMDKALAASLTAAH